MYRVTDVKRVLVVGAGTMGSQIALQTAMSGRYDVTLVDSVEGQLERARAQNTRLLDRAVEKGRMTREAATAALAGIHAQDDLAAAAAGRLPVTSLAARVVCGEEDLSGARGRMRSGSGRPHTAALFSIVPSARSSPTSS